jgi:molecular chaperone GrpE
MEDEKKIEPARNVSPARNDVATSGEHSDAGGEKLKEEVDEIEKKVGVKKDIKKFFKKAEKKESKEEEYLLGWRRCLADFENYKKRQQENQKSLGEYLKIDSTLQILPVIDNFRSATEHIPAEQKEVPWVVGIMYIQKQLEDILKENGVTEMDVKVGDEFDPNLHEAISDSKLRNVSESTKKKEGEFENKIRRVVLRGYKLNEKVIRAARVIVE